MAKLTCTRHGDQANDLVLYWRRQTKREVKAKSWFMAALALGSALEALMYAYFIIWSGDEGNDPAKDEKIPDDLALFDLIEAAKQVDLLSPVKFKDRFGEHAVEDVILEISRMRNNVHAGAALKKNFSGEVQKERLHAVAGHLRRGDGQLQPTFIAYSSHRAASETWLNIPHWRNIALAQVCAFLSPVWRTKGAKLR